VSSSRQHKLTDSYQLKLSRRERDRRASRFTKAFLNMKTEMLGRAWRSLVLLAMSVSPSLAVSGPVAFGSDASALLSYPVAVACDDDGRIFIADLHLPGLLCRDSKGTLSILFRGSTRIRTPLHSPRAVAIGRDGSWFVADSATCEVYRLRDGEPPIPLTAGAFEIPTGLAVSHEGDLFVTDLRLGTVSRVPCSGGAPVTIARVPSPRGLALEPEGNLIVVSMGPDALIRVSAGGVVRPIVTGRPFRFPCAVLRDEANSGFVVSDSYAATLWFVSSDGKVHRWVKGAPLVRPEGLARDCSGAVLVADPGARQVFRINSEHDLEPLIVDPN
jgi:streptogramin lyase